MPTNAKILHLTLCGPGDVAAEMEVAREVVETWNTHHGDGQGVMIKVAHWKTDSVPDAGGRGQAVINRQLIDTADLLVCIFFSRFGSSTGLAASGTQEEIQRGIDAGKKVMVYFAAYEPPADAKAGQLARLKAFAADINNRALTARFADKAAFKTLFETHLAKAVYELKGSLSAKGGKRRKTNAAATTISQRGKSNVIVNQSKNVRVYQRQPVEKIVSPPPEGSISREQCLRVRQIIEELAEGTLSGSRDNAFRQWWGKFYREFKVPKYEHLLATDMPAVEDWARQQKAIQLDQSKTKDPDGFRSKKIGSIKKAMKKMGLDGDERKAEYYREVAVRLKIKPFTSLTQVGTGNIDRIARMAVSDSKKTSI